MEKNAAEPNASIAGRIVARLLSSNRETRYARRAVVGPYTAVKGTRSTGSRHTLETHNRIATAIETNIMGRAPMRHSICRALPHVKPLVRLVYRITTYVVTLAPEKRDCQNMAPWSPVSEKPTHYKREPL
jgi:hypothetical protein